MKNCFIVALAQAALILPWNLSAQDPVDPLAETLETIEASIELHEWLTLLDMADATHRQTQLGMGMNHAQYIAELLGLNYEGNSIAGEDQTVDQGDLSQIRQVEWKRRKHEAEWISVMGTVTMNDGEVLLLEINLVKSKGGYALTGAVG
tara:strand:- start:6653 stop:7099 length:447 start_codon:yes stop_codon:yes gene_type:complete